MTKLLVVLLTGLCFLTTLSEAYPWTLTTPVGYAALIPLIKVEAGYKTAGLTTYCYNKLDCQATYLLLSGNYDFIGLITSYDEIPLMFSSPVRVHYLRSSPDRIYRSKGSVFHKTETFWSGLKSMYQIYLESEPNFYHPIDFIALEVVNV